jgi:hypothetical protein
MEICLRNGSFKFFMNFQKIIMKNQKIFMNFSLKLQPSY